MGLQEKNVQVLLNETSVNIILAVNEVSKRDGIDTLIVYFTGHGQNTGDNQLHIIARDTHKIDEELLNDISYSYIKEKLSGSKALQKIILIDTCHSGLATQGTGDAFDFEPVSGTFTLASTSADESAYFKKEAQNTYFTGFLIDAFRKGMPSTNEMLSLQDLYDYTKNRLADAKLPAPTRKSQLENIIAEKFFISHNPAFSLEKRLKRPKQLHDDGDYEAAKRDYLLLLNTYPENAALNFEYLEFEKNIMYNLLVSEADRLFYEEKKYKAALNKYKDALSIKVEDHVKNKIIECRKKELLPGVTNNEIERQPTATTHNEPLGASSIDHDPYTQKKPKLRPLILVSILLISTIIYFIYLFTKHDNDNKTGTKGHESITDTASKKTDSSKNSTSALLVKDKIDVSQNTTSPDIKSKDLAQNISQAIKKPEVNEIKELPTGNSTSVAGNLGGVVYEESTNNNSLAFSYITKNKIHYEGSIADYPVSGEFIVSNKILKANAGNIEGYLTLSEDMRFLSGYLKIKDRDITKKVNLVKK